MMLSLHINVQSGKWIYIKCSNIVDQKFSWIQKIQKKTEIKKANNGEVILPFLMFSQPAECRGVGNRAILRPPLTFSATLYRFSMEALWELRVLSDTTKYKPDFFCFLDSQNWFFKGVYGRSLYYIHIHAWKTEERGGRIKHRHRRNVMSYRFKSHFKLFSLFSLLWLFALVGNFTTWQHHLC